MFNRCRWDHLRHQQWLIRQTNLLGKLYSLKQRVPFSSFLSVQKPGKEKTNIKFEESKLLFMQVYRMVKYILHSNGNKIYIKNCKEMIFNEKIYNLQCDLRDRKEELASDTR